MLAVHKTQDVRNGQVVVARIDEEVTVKRLKKQGNVVELLPEKQRVFPRSSSICASRVLPLRVWPLA
ncbi:SOS-response repressor and protease LexA [Klebsiella pneumoniae]|uniref:SOS-response repressor and protease LexA n=1 Tax=Klebsiella pneumoniae TaxID=573 RepID=A0A3S4HB20_KLEPN|nr:SOS-response repressor and protease LexA [Klebsiella pneumoniae]